MFEGTDGHPEVSGGETVPHGGQILSFRGMCDKGREHRGSVPVGEASESARGLTRVQYPSRVNKKDVTAGCRHERALRG